MDEYYLHEQVWVLNPYTLVWEIGKIMGKFFDFTDPKEPHFYTVGVKTGMFTGIYAEQISKLSTSRKSLCECGAAASKQPGHSGWCPEFRTGVI